MHEAATVNVCASLARGRWLAFPVPSGQQFPHHLALVHAGETEIESCVAIRELFVIEAENAQDRGVQIVDVQAVGGNVVAEIPFESGEAAQHDVLLRQMLASKPDALLFVSSAVDTARFAQQARQLGASQKLISVEWSATEQLIEFGGRAVDGLFVAQFFDRNDTSPDYLAFRKAYEKRFQASPGFGSLAAYDATRAVLEALVRGNKGASLKTTLLEQGPYTGAQQAVTFDRFGDAQRRSFVTTIHDGQFVVVE